MFKKLLSTVAGAALVIGATNAIAQPGPYVGAALGGNQGSWSVEDNNGVNYGFSTRGVIGTLFGGFAFNPLPFYIAVEGFINEASNRSGTKTIDSGTVDRYTRQSYSYGVSILPGINIVECAQLYVRGGIARSHFQVTDTTVGLGTVSNGINLTGAQAGLGLQVAISEPLDARVEYIYTNYNTYSNVNGNFTPRDNQINVGFAWRLG